MAADPANTRFFLGVDGGGTSSKAIAFDASGNKIGTSLAGPSNPNNIGFEKASAHLVDAIRQIKIPQDASLSICFGIAGLRDDPTTQSLKSHLLQQMPALSEARLRFTHDLEIAHAAAFGDEAGITLIAGTGSACFARTENGHTLRASGRDYEYEDPGSGYAIAQRAFSCGLIDEAKPSSRSDIAALASKLTELASQGDVKAHEILEIEASHLARLIAPIVSKFPSPIPISLSGTLLTADTPYRDLVHTALLEYAPAIEFRTLKVSPETGAARISWQMAHPNQACPF